MPMQSESVDSRNRAPSATRSTPSLVARPGNGSSNGARIGPYSVGKTLGVGSTGRVKLGVHLETGKKVAIKIIPKNSLKQDEKTPPTSSDEVNSDQAAKKLEREIVLMRLLRHPNVMQLYDVYESDNDLYLILEHVEGGELFDYLVKRGRLPDAEALRFFQQIIFGVEFCHRHLICHRDLKPENLLLDREYNIKIADFGMASLQPSGKMLETSCGSPHYASPEIIRGVRYDGGPADIWSCGVILYALLTGNLPFDDENIRRLLTKVKSGVYYIPDYISESAKDLIKRMLTVEPKQRITMDEILKHPWFCMHPPKGNTQRIPGALDKERLNETGSMQPEILDPEIIKSLSMLGFGDERRITELVQQTQYACIHAQITRPSHEKVFYNLLYQRKWEFFENYDIAKLNEYDVEGGPKRRADSMYTLYSEKSRSRMDLFKSSDNLGKDKNKSRDELFRSRDSLGSAGVFGSEGNLLGIKTNESPAGSAASSIKSDDDSEQKAESQKPKLVINAACVKISSPLSAGPVKINATGAGNEPVTPQSASPRKSPNKLTIAIPVKDKVEDLKREEGVSPGGPLGSPKFHRRKAALPSPVITTTPKKSWFASLFNFKPEVFILPSTQTYLDTMQCLREILQSSNVKFQERKDGNGLKCKFEAGSGMTSPISPTGDNDSLLARSPDSKSVKFKIELFPEGSVHNIESHSKWKVQFTHQQGAFSKFQRVFDGIHGVWDLA